MKEKNLVINSYAKINLHLSVLNRRDDGYHNIFSIMASVGLHDLLKLESAELTAISGTESSVAIGNAGGNESAVLSGLNPEKNLVYIAAMKYLQKAGLTADIAFSIEKNIPAGAGLGGGSSNAAAALILLNRHFKKLAHEELIELGSQIGADVPFCLTGGCALCKGTGTVIEPLKGTPDYHVVIANNGTHVDTGWAYRSLKRGTTATLDEKTVNDLEKAFRMAFETNSVSDILSKFQNDFEDAVYKEHPELKSLKDSFYEAGAVFSQMTGSGSTIIALFDDEKKADSTLEKLKDKTRLLIKTGFIKN